jgi:hypothetical protein
MQAEQTRLARVIWFILWLVLLASVVIATTLLVTPYPLIKGFLDSQTPDGNLESFTPGFFDRLRQVMIFAIGLGVLLVASGWYFRAPVQRYISTLPGNSLAFLKRIIKDARQISKSIRCLETERRYLFGLVLITALGGLVRGIYLMQPMRYDESYTFLVFARRSFEFMTSNYHLPNNHVFHTLLVGLFYRLFGASPWVLRLPAYLSGVLSLPLTYLLSSRLYNRKIALAATALLAVASFNIEYSSMARGYTLQLLLILIAALAAVYLTRHSSIIAWMGFILSLALAFYTLPTTLYAAGGLGIWLVANALTKNIRPSQSRKKIAIGLTISALAVSALTLLLYLPVFRNHGWNALSANFFVRPLDPADFWNELSVAWLVIWRAWVRDLPGVVAMAMGIGFLGSLFQPLINKRFRLPMFLSILLWSLPVLIIQRVVPPPRVWIFLLPFFLIEVAAGWGAIIRVLLRLWKKPNYEFPRQLETVYIASVGLITMLLAWNVVQSGTILTSGQTGTLPEAEQITDYLAGKLQPGDVVASSVPSNYPLRYYFYRQGMSEDLLYAPGMGDEFGRVWVIVNSKHGQELVSVLEQTRLTGWVDTTMPITIVQFGQAELYLLEKK